MIVTDSSMTMQSQQLKFEFYQRKESLFISDSAGQTRPQTDQPPSSDKNQAAPGTDIVSLSGRARQMHESAHARAMDRAQEKLMGDLNIRILKDLIERLTGKQIRLQDMDAVIAGAESKAAHEISASAKAADPTALSDPAMEYVLEETYIEAEYTDFEASGQILTADGRQIGFSVSLSMSRKFIETNEVRIRDGKALKDPLVINFGGTAAQLSQTTFDFDLDCNGTPEQISRLKGQSGFLALDKNGDGIVNDGSELFGPATGSGFSELAGFDEDGNGWIDENDSIYDRLRIWTKTPDGDDQLFALGQKGIGAICLAGLSSPFSLTGPENQLLGRIRETGVFLYESGWAGTVQELDL